MRQYASDWTSQTNWVELAGTTWPVFEPEPLNAFECIEAVLTATFEEEPREAYFWEQSDISSPWNIYWTDAAREGGSRDIHDQVFGQHRRKYLGIHIGLFTHCDPEEACNCE
jgi:hypothetical protein